MPTGAEVTLPEGRVTMLFTDIEGSTALLRALGPAYADVLRDQRRIIRAAIAEHHGHEMGTEGDSFFVVFADPRRGVDAVVDAQRALAANHWPGGTTVRVRMGLHCGDVARHEEGYVGLELNRAARIASTANGGQVVVSASIRDAVERPGVSWRDLGRHRLKDLPVPEPLFQLVAEDLPDITTPVKSLGAPSNLPAVRTDLLGRAADIEALRSLLGGEVRLVTLTGPGGVGKTSLGIAAAAALDIVFPGGVYFVALANATRADDAFEAIATTVGTAGGGAEDAISSLSTSPSLLVLDNLEQLGSAGADVVTALLDATQASVLATSRSPLRVRGEQQYPVLPLDDAASAELFVREARRARPSFDVTGPAELAVVDICRKVDGLPLAVELIASRVRHLGLDAIARAVDERLDVASRERDRPDRHRTLAATVAWSYDLLDAELQRLFRQLSVFAGGSRVKAAGEVLGISEAEAFDVLDELADLSLIAFTDDGDGDPRVSMLRVVREFAAAELARRPDEEADARRAHARHFVAVAESAEGRLRGREQQAAGDELALEHDNLRAAFDWAARAGEPQLAARIAVALGWFWYTHGRHTEGRVWLERVADGDIAALAPAVGVRAFHLLGVLRQQEGQNDAALDAFGRALELARSAEDASATARALNSIGVAHWAEGRLDSAREYIDEGLALSRSIDDDERVASGLSNLGVVLLTAGDQDGAVAVLREALAIDRRRSDRWAVAADQTNLGAALVRRGDLDEGVRNVRGALPIALDLGDPDIVASGIEVCAMAAAIRGRSADAVKLAAAADAIRTEVSLPRSPADDAYFERELGPARADLGRAAVDALAAKIVGRSIEELACLALEDS